MTDTTVRVVPTGPERDAYLPLTLTAVHARDALERGCATASLRSTQMAEGVYGAVGFRDLGRILECVPPDRS